jgi:adenosylhomocysteine nucleosidase
MAILYVASEAAELKPLANLLTALRKLKWPIDYAYEGIWEGRRLMLAANGAGPALAARAVETAIRAVMVAELSSSKLEAVVSCGWCGALDPALQVSQIVVGTQVIDAATGEKFDCAPIQAEGEHVTGVVVSQNRIAHDSAEKERLYASGAIAVDMESAGAAARAKRAGLPFCCIRVVSDSATESFPFDLNDFRTASGKIARGKIVAQALAHPNRVPALLHLRRHTTAAATALGEFLVSCRIASESDVTSAE